MAAQQHPVLGKYDVGQVELADIVHMGGRHVWVHLYMRHRHAQATSLRGIANRRDSEHSKRLLENSYRLRREKRRDGGREQARTQSKKEKQLIHRPRKQTTGETPISTQPSAPHHPPAQNVKPIVQVQTVDLTGPDCGPGNCNLRLRKNRMGRGER